MTFNPPTLFIAHCAMCRWHEIHSPTYSTVWCVGLLLPHAALRLNQEQICKTSILERWCAWRTGSGQASLWSAPCFPNTGCLCSAPRVYFACKRHLEMGNFSAVECLKTNQSFKRSCFPSCSPTVCGEMSPTAKKTVSPTAIIQGVIVHRSPGAQQPTLPNVTGAVQPRAGAWWELLLPELLALRGLSGTEGSLWSLLFSMTQRKRRSKKKTTSSFYLSHKKGRQDCAMEPAAYPLRLLTKS